jgi:hypothetical protein
LKTLVEDEELRRLRAEAARALGVTEAEARWLIKAEGGVIY